MHLSQLIFTTKVEPTTIFVLLTKSVVVVAASVSPGETVNLKLIFTTSFSVVCTFIV